jgi:hypothetical protein
MTKKAAVSAKVAAITAKVAAIPVEERLHRAVVFAQEGPDQPTDEQTIEFAKLFFGPDIIVNM